MKKILIVLGILIALMIVASIGMRIYTKSFSPEGRSIYNADNVNIDVKYGRPYKKGREIFGDLVPFNEVWRTGANEPTIFTTSVDLEVAGSTLPAGNYAIFTIPMPTSWKVIFNSEIPSWGVGLSGDVPHNPETDVLTAEVSSIVTKKEFEQFTIDFEEMHNEIDMVFMWDHTLVVLPMRVK